MVRKACCNASNNAGILGQEVKPEKKKVELDTKIEKSKRWNLRLHIAWGWGRVSGCIPGPQSRLKRQGLRIYSAIFYVSHDPKGLPRMPQLFEVRQ